MLKVSVANATASALKRSVLLAILAGLLIVGLWAYRQQARCTLKLEQGCVSLETAITPEQRAKGLGGRQSLADNQGMLFIYDQPQKACFWMKDTNFNLDMIWLNQDKQITKIETNVTPESYPTSYCADASTKYVIELTAGAVARNQLAIGQQLHF